MQGGTGTDSANLHQPSSLPERFEAGTPNYPGIVSLMAGINYIAEIGFDKISSHLKACTHAFYNAINNSDKVIKYSSSPDIPVFPVNIKRLDADTAGFILHRSNGIISRTGLHCAPLIHKQITNGEGCIRLSPSIFTDPDDCRFAGETISDLAENVKIATK
jgi:selenocysteine lyase/cysteine desulfurase